MSVGAMLDSGILVRAACNRCGQHRDVDSARLIRAKGRDYSLIDRRAPCRFTAGCSGTVRFHYLLGVMRPLWTQEAVERWMWESVYEDVERALAALREARDLSYAGSVQSPRLAAALASLKPRCPDRAALDWFWASAGWADPVGRWQNCNAALNAILRQLGRTP